MKRLSLVALLALTACALPHTDVRTATLRPTLSVVGAPARAQLFVDGIAAGDASQYDGVRQTLTVEEGPHQLRVAADGQDLYRQQVLLTNGERHVIRLGEAAR
ncbi:MULTISPECIES: hypothetical protein [Microvirgula]|uniref:PEGA domain-containing protein n=1 Tax=Microvirgula aerodenitrificans TaxID=57480 RepID=A0A2S0P859_9NEIS|nr:MULTISPECIES: hypothetical protein [Microvirgula]AVY93546.1 hypothetical protein DAI18_05415 [Microvirgula aerodenitrificans]RAS20083.1 hypothetical protein DFO50_101473 [Microvirgula sp. AG722]